MHKLNNYEDLFLKKGYTPLEKIKNTKQKIKCIDAEGYMYFASYELLRDEGTKRLDKWKKKNPYKCYNMRLYASIIAPDVEIISTDAELQDADNIKTKFKCPNCGEVYEKRWYHWIAQPKGRHLCQKCNRKIRDKERLHTYEELVALYQEKGLTLISDYQFYVDNGGCTARMHCKDEEGYKYAANSYAIKEWKTGHDVRYSITNPYAVENLRLWCSKNRPELEIIAVFQDADTREVRFLVRCECGNLFEARAYVITSEARVRCTECTKRESSLERKTREWLEEHNIPYDSQYRFEDCKYKRSLPFDFKIDWNGGVILIEADGAQHYYIDSWKTKEEYEYQQIRDKIKTEYCKNKGYTLLRIPAWDFTRDTYKTKLNKTFFG